MKLGMTTTSSPKKEPSSPASTSRGRRSSTSSKNSGNSSTANPVVASFSKATHPYSAVVLSPCRQYAVAACKDSLQLLRVGEFGVKYIKTVLTNPFFAADVRNNNSNSNNNARGNNNDNLNLRDFAFGQRAAQQAQASVVNVVLTSLAWSSSSSGGGDDHVQRQQQQQQHVGTISENLRSSLIAVAGSNGVIVVWNAGDLFEETSTTQQQPEAVLKKHARAVNRLAFHPTKTWILLSASQDGTIVLWERRKSVFQKKDDESTKQRSFFFRNKANTIQRSFQWINRSTFAPKSEAVRDIRWSPFSEDLFALVTSSGSLIVYNQYITARAMVKLSAHSGDATTLDWHPRRPFIVATGGASDRSVKIWDLEKQLSLREHAADESNIERNANTMTSRADSVGSNADSSTGQDSYMNGVTGTTVGVSTSMFGISSASRAVSSISSGGFPNAARANRNPKNMIHMLTISAAVTRLQWRPPSNETFAIDDEDRNDSMMAVATAPIKGLNAGGSGVLALWSYNRPFMPLSVVEGHKEGAVTDFNWLETPLAQKPTITSQSYQVSDSSNLRSRIIRSTEDTAGGTSIEVVSRLPGVASREVDSILFDNTDHGDDTDAPLRIWQHVLSVGRDGRCLIQSFTRGDRPISRVPPSCFAMANLSPFQKGYGSLQLFTVSQSVPSGPRDDFFLTGLRRDGLTARAPGIFREVPSEPEDTNKGPQMEWRAGRRLPESCPELVFSVVDQGDLDRNSNPIIPDDEQQTMTVAPEVLHLSRFADRYVLYLDDSYPYRSSLCLHNAEVAESLQCHLLAYMWRMVASMLESTGLDGLPNSVRDPQNAMQFVIFPTIASLLEERADAGDVQTCVALCEVLQVVDENQTVRIPTLKINLVREWYLAYIELLRDMCLFSHATFLIRNCQDPYIGALNQQSTTIHESCPHCGKALLQEDAAGNAENTYARRVCKSCRRRVGFCFLCHEPVKGVYIWCQGCGHGGHLEHALQWFGGNGKAVREVCPTGCGHRCNFVKELSAFPRTESFCQPVSDDESVG